MIRHVTEFSFFMLSNLVAIFFVLGCFVNVKGDTYDCKFTNNGQTFDFSPLMSPTDYKISYNPTDPKQNIWINMCTSVVYNLCGTVSSACQQWDPLNKNGQASLGKVTSVAFSYGTQQSGSTGPIAVYTGGDLTTTGVPRSMQIDFVCSPNSGTGKVTYVDENKTTFRYYFLWTTQYACTNSPNIPSGSSGDDGLSGGSIFLIIFFVCVFVYFAAGIAYKKFKVHAEGIELLPNTEFWISFPGLIKDGCLFIKNKITGSGGSSYSTVK